MSISKVRNGLKVRNGSKHLILGGLLLIRQVSPEDAGEYFCFVKNTAGEDGGGIDLQVRDRIVGKEQILLNYVRSPLLGV